MLVQTATCFPVLIRAEEFNRRAKFSFEPTNQKFRKVMYEISVRFRSSRKAPGPRIIRSAITLGEKELPMANSGSAAKLIYKSAHALGIAAPALAILRVQISSARAHNFNVIVVHRIVPPANARCGIKDETPLKLRTHCARFLSNQLLTLKPKKFSTFKTSTGPKMACPSSLNPFPALWGFQAGRAV